MASTWDHIQQREEHWAIVDLVGKGGHIRTVPVPDWVRNELNDWLVAAAIDRGKLFRRVNKFGKTWGDGITEKAVWHIVKESAKTVGIAKLAPHDLRRTCARLCHASGGELEQIQFLLGHVSIQTTERYLGCKQRIRSAVNVNDRIGIEPSPWVAAAHGRIADQPPGMRRHRLQTALTRWRGLLGTTDFTGDDGGRWAEERGVSTCDAKNRYSPCRSTSLLA